MPHHWPLSQVLTKYINYFVFCNIIERTPLTRHRIKVYRTSWLATLWRQEKKNCVTQNIPKSCMTVFVAILCKPADKKEKRKQVSCAFYDRPQLSVGQCTQDGRRERLQSFFSLFSSRRFMVCWILPAAATAILSRLFFSWSWCDAPKKLLWHGECLCLIIRTLSTKIRTNCLNLKKNMLGNLVVIFNFGINVVKIRTKDILAILALSRPFLLWGNFVPFPEHELNGRFFFPRPLPLHCCLNSWL